MTLVCRTDGVAVGASRSGRLVHLGELPKGTDPDHEVEAVEADELVSTLTGELLIRDAAHDMLEHHAALCPSRQCEWAERLRQALK